MEKYAIIKFVNYNTTTLDRAKRLSWYIRELSRTNEKYVTTQYLSKTNVEHGLKVIEDRWKPKGTRSFKQGILSFGVSCNEFSPEEAVKMTKEALQYFTHLPWVAAVHINKPQNLHAHFLLGMTNIADGKKYSQGPNDLKKFKSHYNAIAQKYGLPLVHGYGIESNTDLLPKILNPNVVSVDIQPQSNHYHPADSLNVLIPSPNVLNFPPSVYQYPQEPKEIFDGFREDYHRFFLFGYGRGNL